ncbi:hypothetical protein [Streptomyces sp. Wh19]|uniref:hypothetical protein n=1 Tax=Streptomyces sp. Wh19 TaxID=3076629 RepID=UPI002958970C|nr:hypothetical protein [Streptomyces sp. Wh19]MDV9194663.1 hypothetical protein [Streptomyces sp. Wh19]
MTKTTTTTTTTLRLTDPAVREQLEALPASLVLIGLTTDGQPVCVDLDADSPHVLVCTGTGGGATTVLRTLAAQLLRHGSHALVLDLKRISHRWASGLPGVTYCREISDVHDALVGLRAELQHRLALIEQRGDIDDLPRLTLVFEGAAAALRQLARYWDTIREKGDPKTSPAVDAFEYVLFAGPQARIHVLATSQLTTGVLGEGRENFSTKVLGRVTTRTFQHLAPEIHPTPEPNTHPGRVHVVQGWNAHPTQVLLLTDDEAAAGITATAAGTI